VIINFLTTDGAVPPGGGATSLRTAQSDERCEDFEKRARAALPPRTSTQLSTS
jgi:hypothetical protein